MSDRGEEKTRETRNRRLIQRQKHTTFLHKKTRNSALVSSAGLEQQQKSQHLLQLRTMKPDRPNLHQYNLHTNRQPSISESEKDAISFHIIFGVIALTVLLTIPPERLGLPIWMLVIGWHLAIFSTAYKKNHHEWLQMMKFITPLCTFFIFPDGCLATYLQTIVFPNTMGVGQIYNVTSFMPFMWAIPIFITILVGCGMEQRGVGIINAATSAGFVACLIFTASEDFLTRIPIWYATDKVTTFGNVAIYVVFPEFCLGFTSFCMYRYSRRYSLFGMHIVTAFMVMCMYLGNLVVCFMIIDGIQ